MSNSLEQSAADILRRILAKTDAGPSECFGADMAAGAVWKGSFRTLLDEAHSVVEPVGFGAI